ncbi:MAG: DNRLRE domain-containing protein, partial [bacterium]|nr:DNRLRE domain-containing protein [bacterium]
MRSDEQGGRNTTIGRSARLLALGAIIALNVVAGPARAEVTIFQQGVSPTAKYAGCTDTYIERSGYTRPRHEAEFLWTAGTRKGLIRFDISALGKERKIHRALLRLYLVEVPNQKVTVLLYTPARQWDATAMWGSYQAVEHKPCPEHKWSTPGGDLDMTSDFGTGKAGLVASAGVRGGPFGHIVELDVTRLAAEWVSGRRPNYGFLIDKPSYSAIQAASSEDPNKEYRPELVIEHYAANETPTADVALKLPPAPGPDARLLPLAETKNARESSEPWRTIRLGRNSNCQYRHGHMAGYAKQDVRYPGNWGWTPRIRIGGTGGDLNHAGLYFNLSALPPSAVIKRATLKVFAEVGNQRVPDAELTLGQVPAGDERKRLERIRKAIGAAKGLADYAFGLYAISGEGLTPGWSDNEFTFVQARNGQAWTTRGGTLAEATDSPPAAIANLSAQWSGMLKSDAEMPDTWIAWDVTGLVRAWTQDKLPNRGLVLDGRLTGGEMLIYSDQWVDADRRPYLEVELAGESVAAADGPFEAAPLVPAGDYWVGPMKKAHAQ